MNQDFTGIDKKKADLLKEFISLSSGKNSDDLLPLMLAFSQKAKKDKISFTKEEITNIAKDLQKDMPPEEKSRVDMLLKMASVM